MEICSNSQICNPNIINVGSLYKSIAQEFCNKYYTTYDTNYQNLIHFYKPESFITYQQVEVSGFNNLYQLFVNNNMTKFTHSIISIDAQPMGVKTVMITVLGTVKINDYLLNSKSNSFSESFILQKDDLTQTFYIYNHICRIVIN